MEKAWLLYLLRRALALHLFILVVNQLPRKNHNICMYSLLSVMRKEIFEGSTRGSLVNLRIFFIKSPKKNLSRGVYYIYIYHFYNRRRFIM